MHVNKALPITDSPPTAAAGLAAAGSVDSAGVADTRPSSYTWRYILALVLIAVLSVSGFHDMRAHLKNGAALSDTIDDVIYQYAVANRILDLTKSALNAKTETERYLYTAGLKKSYADLVANAARVQETVSLLPELTRKSEGHSPLGFLAGLTVAHPDAATNIAESLAAIYLDPPYSLDTRFRDITSLTELFIASTDTKEQRVVAQQIDSLVQHGAAEGTRLVGLGLQEASHYQMEIAAQTLSIFTALTLLTLLTIGTFVFRPLFRRVVATEHALNARIEEQKGMLSLVEQAETRLRVALEGMEDGLWDWDLRTNDVYYSDRWLSMLGYARGDLPATLETWQQVLYPADRQLAYQAVERHFADPNQPFQMTLRYLHKDGGVRYILARGKALRDSEGKPYRMMGGHTDVTELTKTQEGLREQKLILELFTHNAPVAVAMLDRQLRFLNISTRWLNDYNLTEKGIIGQSFFTTHSSFPVRWVSALREALSGIPSNADEDSFEKPSQNGRAAETVFVRWRIQPWRDSQGFIGGVILFSEMITEEVRLRRDVARASGLNQALAEFVSTEVLYTGDAIEPSLEEICRFAAQALQVCRAGVWRIDDDGDVAVSLRLFDAKAGEFQTDLRLLRVDCFNFFARLSMNRSVVFEDAASSDLISPALLEYLGAAGVQSAICVPIRVEQKIWGFLTLAANTVRPWHNFEQFFAQRLADVVAISLTAHQRHLLNASLVKAREAAETATVTKSRFVANMSHEVRTPLNGIIGVAEILSRTELSAKQSELVDVLQSSCQHLLALVSDILDFSKLEAGGVTLESIPLNLGQLLRELTDLMRPKTDDSPVELIVRYQPRLPLAFIGDPTRIRQVLMNLLSNAAKFTSEGSIVVSVTGEETDKGIWQIAFAVTDSGIGIPADKIGTLFEKFTQADSSTTRKYGGTGLGLTIIKELSELMGGKIDVASTEGHGSTFTVTIPLHVDRNVPLALPPANLRGGHVLLFDDNINTQQALLEQLSGLGMRGTAFTTIASAMEAAEQAVLEKASFDLALIDVENEDALALAAAIKREDRLRSISLVAMRASEKVTEETLLTKGFVASLRKPVLPTDLMHMLQGVMQARRTGNMTTLFASGHTAAKAPTSQHNALKGARILLAEDNDTNQMIVTHFLTELGCLPVVAATGREALSAFTREPDFAAILMDCQMPDMDGFAATAAIRALPQGANVPIIALTANAQESDRDICLNAGMSDYLAKPVRMDVLRQKLTSLFEPAQAPRQPPAPSTKPVPDLPEQPLSMADLLKTFDNDKTIIDRILVSFISNTTALLSQAVAQLKDRNFTALAKTAHTLKGSSLSVFAGPMADDAKKLEQTAKDGNELECGYLLNLLRRHANQIENIMKSNMA